MMSLSKGASSTRRIAAVPEHGPSRGPNKGIKLNRPFRIIWAFSTKGVDHANDRKADRG
jgi:hypothetical protein